MVTTLPPPASDCSDCGVYSHNEVNEGNIVGEKGYLGQGEHKVQDIQYGQNPRAGAQISQVVFEKPQRETHTKYIVPLHDSRLAIYLRRVAALKTYHRGIGHPIVTISWKLVALQVEWVSECATLTR